MKKGYKTNFILQQIVDQQQKDIDQLENNIINNEFVIETLQKKSDQYVLICKFLTDILILASQLEQVLDKDANILTESLAMAIATFKIELRKAMQTVHYDGGDSFSFDSFTNDNNSKMTNDDEGNNF